MDDDRGQVILPGIVRHEGVEMTAEEQKAREQEEFSTGPLSILKDSERNNVQVLIKCRNNKKLLGRVKAFDSN